MPNNKSQNTLYESYAMLHPDGTLMCRCNAKRAQWYVARNLAEWQDEHTFRLKFAPHGHGKSSSAYYTQKIENKCVVCGATEDLNKHHVMPYVFRSRMPVAYKQSNHHDVLATCVDCHEDYEGHATTFKAQLCAQYNTDMNMALAPEFKHNKKVRSARNMVHKVDNDLLVDKEQQVVVLPPERLSVLREWAAKPLLDEANPGAVWADKIMEQVLANGELFSFVKAWRQHFLDYAKPQHLPPHWSVNHPLEVVDRVKQR